MQRMTPRETVFLEVPLPQGSPTVRHNPVWGILGNACVPVGVRITDDVIVRMSPFLEGRTASAELSDLADVCVEVLVKFEPWGSGFTNGPCCNHRP